MIAITWQPYRINELTDRTCIHFMRSRNEKQTVCGIQLPSPKRASIKTSACVDTENNKGFYYFNVFEEDPFIDTNIFEDKPLCEKCRRIKLKAERLPCTPYEALSNEGKVIVDELTGSLYYNLETKRTVRFPVPQSKKIAEIAQQILAEAETIGANPFNYEIDKYIGNSELSGYKNKLLQCAVEIVQCLEAINFLEQQ
ncbi:MAG: hypothetical protein ACRYFS_10345 [Janthinobacterium lividum]